jgi:hypothetical protein
MNDTFRRLLGALGERYLLEREIGAGGMATVYLAQDLRHRRPVALKVIRPELSGPLGLERFLREIELAARLQHPHILPVFDSGVVESGAGAPLPYFVMPFVEFGEARRLIDAALADRDSVRLPGRMRGLLVATGGWGELLEGDSVAGIRRLREGLEIAAAPGQEAEYESSFLRFQLALGLAARAETRQEGIQRLRNGFDLQSLYIPLSFLALGQAWEAAGERDSAAFAYGRFLQLWDKPDPELRWRVAEARAALQRLTAEPRP